MQSEDLELQTEDLRIKVSKGGSIYILEPISKAGKLWIENNIGKENGYQPYYPRIIVEHRFIDNIVDGALADGLEIATDLEVTA